MIVSLIVCPGTFSRTDVLYRPLHLCHCTGNQAIKMFMEEYSENFIQAWVGQVIVVEP